MKVVLADDHQLMLSGIRRALEADGGFEIVGETQNGAQVLPLVARTQPDLVLLDLRMPNMDGLACLDEIKRRHPGGSRRDALGLPERADDRGGAAPRRERLRRQEHRPDRSAEHAAAGARGERLQRRRLDGGQRRHGPRAAGLTDREISILKALAKGLSNDEIAKEFWVARQTVKFHLTNIYRKLEVRNRAEAIRKAYSFGLVESPIYGGGDDE